MVYLQYFNLFSSKSEIQWYENYNNLCQYIY